MELPMIPFGGLIGIGMILGSFSTKGSTKDILFYGGIGMWGYHAFAGFSNLNEQYNGELGEFLSKGLPHILSNGAIPIDNQSAYSRRAYLNKRVAPGNYRIRNLSYNFR